MDASRLRLDMRDGRLYHDGRPVDLRPKTWQLAQYMVARPDQLLSKEELLQAVWGDTVVTEASLTHAIRELLLHQKELLKYLLEKKQTLKVNSGNYNLKLHKLLQKLQVRRLKRVEKQKKLKKFSRPLNNH